MGLPQPSSPLLTIDEYIALEHKTGIKHEYHRGEVRAMAGGSPEHSQVAAQVIFVLASRLKGRRCQPFSSDLKVAVAGRYFYPDVSVVCAPMKRDQDLGDAVTNPRVIIEVISPATVAYDRGEKFAHYRLIESLTDYVLIDPMRPYAEHYTRIDADHWNLEFLGKGSVLRLPSIECDMPVSDCYAGLEAFAGE